MYIDDDTGRRKTCQHMHRANRTGKVDSLKGKGCLTPACGFWGCGERERDRQVREALSAINQASRREEVGRGTKKERGKVS